MSAPSRRAAPLPPEARRASIIAATVPLLRRHGSAVTTAQIAMAAGIAEGTLFRVFPDKETLVQAAVQHAFDPRPAEREMNNIDPALSPREQIIAAVEIMQRRVEDIWQLMSMLGLAPPPPGKSPAPPPSAEVDCAQRKLIAICEPLRGELRCSPEQAARLMRIMTFAGTHPRISDGIALTAAEIVAVVLDGILIRADLDADTEATC